MAQNSNPLEFLTTARANAEAAGTPSLLPFFDSFREFYERKLWHQLLLEIEKFTVLPEAAPYLVDLYNNFVRHFEERLNQLSLVAVIGLQVARLLPNNDERIVFLLALADNIKKKDLRAAVAAALPRRNLDSENDHPDRTRHDDEVLSAELLARTQAAHYQLQSGQFDVVLQHVRDAETSLNELDYIDPRLSCVFYRVAADCYKAQAEYAKFHRTSLLFLSALVSAKTILTQEESVSQAVDLCTAALLSDEIYNFGELVRFRFDEMLVTFLFKIIAHPILDSLSEGPKAWLREVMFAFNAGDIVAYERLKTKIFSDSNFASKQEFLRKKIGVMAIIDYVFQRSASDRVLSFEEIATRISVSELEVEHYLMRALSLKLIKGQIEQTTKSVTITWVMPRVLDRKQVGGIAEMVKNWRQRVSGKLEDFKLEIADLVPSH